MQFVCCHLRYSNGGPFGEFAFETTLETLYFNKTKITDSEIIEKIKDHSYHALDFVECVGEAYNQATTVKRRFVLASKANPFVGSEKVFHDLLHMDSSSSSSQTPLFIEFIRAVQQAGKSCFVPTTMEDERTHKDKTTDIMGVIDYGRLKAITQAFKAPEADTRQHDFIKTFNALLYYSENLLKIDQKTYCIAGINIIFTSAKSKELQSQFITLPCIFISDGMEPDIIFSMKKFLTKYPSSHPVLKEVKGVDYYKRDLQDTEQSMERIQSIIMFAHKNPVLQAILQEIKQKMEEEIASKQIGRFAHAEQRALDRLAVDLPCIIKFISEKIVKDAIEIKRMNVHMLVNNDSCCRCDATIKAMIAKNGWLHERLKLGIKDAPFPITLATNIKFSAAVSSFVPYNTGIELTLNEEEEGVQYYSRGLSSITSVFKKPDKEECCVTQGVALKLYEED